MSNRRAQDERIEGTPDGSNAISEIVDIPDAPTIGTATAGLLSASVAFTPATTGGTVSLFTATSDPGSITGTSATSPITVSGLTGGTEYTFTVSGENSTGTSPLSSASNSITVIDLEGAYDALATVTVPSGGLASVTFTGIPTGYKHLQVRCLTRGTAGTGGTPVYVTVNSDTAANYSTHQLFGNGGGAASNGHSNASYILDGWGGFQSFAGGDTANCFGVGIIDLLDYASTSKYKTARASWGRENNATTGTTGRVFLESGSWRNTAAITSLTFTTDAAYGLNWAQHSSFALYGVK